MPNDAVHPITIALGFDYGTKRIGVAVGNSLTGSAQAVSAIQHKNAAQTYQKIKGLIKEWQPSCLVVGLPLHLDGSEYAMTKYPRSFGKELAKKFGKPIHFVNERYSSVLLEHDFKYQGAVDSHAAGLLLEQFFRERSYHTMVHNLNEASYNES